MNPELVTARNISILQELMQDPDAITLADVPQVIQEATIYFLIKDSKAHIGYCDIHAINQRARTGWLMIWLQKDKRGDLSGITNVIKQLLDYAWNNLNLRKLQADTINDKVAKGLDYLGFEKEGCLKDARYVNGEYVDQCIYGLIRDK